MTTGLFKLRPEIRPIRLTIFINLLRIHIGPSNGILSEIRVASVPRSPLTLAKLVLADCSTGRPLNFRVLLPNSYLGMGIWIRLRRDGPGQPVPCVPLLDRENVY